MKVVIDSNVLLVAIGKTSKYKLIWSAFIEGKYQLIISEDVIHEYEEVLKAHSAPGAAEIVVAVAANADYLVTNDTHFKEAEKLSFPKVTIITADMFLDIVKRLS
jgi:uncharacterized protein